MSEVVVGFQFKDKVVDGPGYTLSDWAYTALLNKHFSGSPNTAIQPWPNSLVDKKSTWYSGEMRRVVQLLAGQNSPIPYEYGAQLCHGIFINQQTGQRWVIEIASTGITAWILPIHSEPFYLPNALPYLPRPTASLPPNAARRELLDAAGMSEVNKGSPLCDELGWAFSYSGHEAQHVHERAGFISPENGLSYEQNFLYIASFEADANGDPISASIPDVSGHWNWHANIQQNIRVPIWVSCGPASARITKWTPTLAQRPITAGYSFPFHVFYIGDTAQVYTYHVGELLEVTTPANPFPAKSGYDFSDDPSIEGQWFNDYDQLVTDQNIHLSGPGLTGHDCAFQEEPNHHSVVGGGFDRMQETVRTENRNVALNVGSQDDVYGSSALIRRENYSNNSYNKSCSFSFIIPFFEREGFYIATRFTEESSNDQHSEDQRWVMSDYARSRPQYVWLHFGEIGGETGSFLAVRNDQCVTDPSCIGYPLCDGGEAADKTEIESFNGLYWFSIQLNKDFLFLSNYRSMTDISPCGRNNVGDQYLYYQAYDINELYDPSEDYYSDKVLDDSGGSSSNTEQTFYFVSHAGGEIFQVELEPSENDFSGTVNDNNTSCAVSTPWHVGCCMDGFGTGKGWITPKTKPDPIPGDPKKIVGDVGTYDLENTPTWSRHSGWFGLPFPEDFP